MKLYFSPGACSLSPHIVAHELGLPLTIDKISNKRTSDDRDFWQINPKGYVPVLELDDGEVLTEGTAIVQYLADQKPEAGLAPPNGTLARYRLQEMLGYINSELHKSYSPLFTPKTPAETREERMSTCASATRSSSRRWPARPTCSAISSRWPTRTCSRSPTGPGW
jgi:glutathione S-transferase